MFRARFGITMRNRVRLAEVIAAGIGAISFTLNR
jgi:hypothetical protein